MTLTIEGKIYQGILEANDSAEAFASLLPTTLTMKELNENEKYIYLDQNIRKDEPTIPSSIKAGDLMLFSDNCVVFFYQDFTTNYSYVPLGHFDIDETFSQRVSKGNVLAAFSLWIQSSKYTYKESIFLYIKQKNIGIAYVIFDGGVEGNRTPVRRTFN